MTFDPKKATSPPFIEPYFFLVNLDTHTYQNQLKPACIKFFPRLDLKMVNFGLLESANSPQQKRTCKIRHARFLQESCMQDLLGTCTGYVPFLARFLHNLAHILQDMVQDFAARVAARIITCISCKILQELVQDCA